MKLPQSHYDFNILSLYREMDGFSLTLSMEAHFPFSHINVAVERAPDGEKQEKVTNANRPKIFSWSCFWKTYIQLLFDIYSITCSLQSKSFTHMWVHTHSHNLNGTWHNLKVSKGNLQELSPNISCIIQQVRSTGERKMSVVCARVPLVCWDTCFHTESSFEGRTYWCSTMSEVSCFSRECFH